MTYTFKKGTEVKSITFDLNNKTEKTLDFGPIIFDYEFKDNEFVTTINKNIKMFQRSSEDGKIHQYFVKWYN